MRNLLRLHIQHGELLDPLAQNKIKKDLFLADGKIVGIGQAPAGFHADQTIDAQNHFVCPGLIDLQARFREPGEENKATIESESLAAVTGGITTLCIPPDTNPMIDHPAIAEWLIQRGEKTGLVTLLPIGALTLQLKGKQLSEMAALQQAGCVAMSQASFPIEDTRVWRRAFEYAAMLDLPVFVRPEDYWLAQGGCVHEGQVSTRLGLNGIPATAETIVVAQMLMLAEQTGVQLHFSQLSVGASVELIANAQTKGIKVTADVAIHQLFLSEMDVDNFNSIAHVRPPLRTLTDQAMLVRGVQEGVIQAICSDHQPHDADSKRWPFPQTAAGISGLETLLPLVWRLVKKNVFNEAAAIAAVTSNPAKILKINTGTLSLNAPADICIFNPKKTWTVAGEQMISRGKNTAYEGWDMVGQVTHTIKNGQVVY